jgi:hypothetical protein
MLFLSGCQKEDSQNYNPPTAGGNSQNYYSVSYSNWTNDANLSWSDGATTEPSRQTEIAAPELTQEMIDAGSVVLVYAQSNVDGSVQPMPAEYADANNDETNVYSANNVAGTILLSHTRSVAGAFQVPGDLNGINFRYIIVTPNTPDPNGRPLTIDNFRYMSYHEVVEVLGIPE